ncbi:MAG: hypothetical protein V1660_00050 [archaeon]
MSWEEWQRDNTFVDSKGYRRFNKSKKLVHRAVAFKHIYNKEKYTLSFKEYIVHHKDLNKEHNYPANLELLMKYEHEKKHNFERQEWTLIRLLIGIIILVVLSLFVIPIIAQYVKDTNTRMILFGIYIAIGWVAILIYASWKIRRKKIIC